jgi:hypothetical protein
MQKATDRAAGKDGNDEDTTGTTVSQTTKAPGEKKTKAAVEGLRRRHHDPPALSAASASCYMSHTNYQSGLEEAKFEAILHKWRHKVGPPSASLVCNAAKTTACISRPANFFVCLRFFIFSPSFG